MRGLLSLVVLASLITLIALVIYSNESTSELPTLSQWSWTPADGCKKGDTSSIVFDTKHDCILFDLAYITSPGYR